MRFLSCKIRFLIQTYDDRREDQDSEGDGEALSGHEVQGVRLGVGSIIEMGQRVAKGTTH